MKGIEGLLTEARMKLDSYILTGIDGFRQQAWDRFAAAGIDMRGVEPNGEGALFMLRFIREHYTVA